jgi:hypothetical protein
MAIQRRLPEPATLVKAPHATQWPAECASAVESLESAGIAASAAVAFVDWPVRS